MKNRSVAVALFATMAISGQAQSFNRVLHLMIHSNLCVS